MGAPNGRSRGLRLGLVDVQLYIHDGRNSLFQRRRRVVVVVVVVMHDVPGPKRRPYALEHGSVGIVQYRRR